MRKQFMSKSFLSAAAVAFVFISCKKTELPSLPKPVTKIDMLTYSSWKLKAEGFDNNNDDSIDIDETPAFPCFLDNLTFFYKEGKGSFDQGQTKCDPNHAQSRKFDWQFINTDSIFI